MSWIAVAIGGSAVLGVGASIYNSSQGPDAPGQRNLNGELNGINNQYSGTLSTYLSGSGPSTSNSLGNLSTLMNGNFDFNAFLAARPDAAGAWTERGNTGEYAGWTPEQFASAYDGNATNTFRSGGLLDMSRGLNTATRTNNLTDAQNLGGQYVNLTRAQNQPYYNALDSFTQAAGQPVQQGASQQQAAQQASQGFGSFNPAGMYANTSFGSQSVNPGMVSAPNSMLSVNAPQGNPLLGQLNQQAMNQGPSGLQQQQNGLASGLLAQGGQLSPSELRNVQQSSRAGFAARGLDATNASVVDETMQTDAAQRARLMQNLGIAQGVQNQGLAEQGQQQQFGLNVGAQNFGYGQLGVQGQTANQGAYQNLNALNLQGQLANQGTGLAAQQSNQSANLQAQNLGLQGQIANQGFGLNSFNANLNSQQAQQQALMQSAQLQEQQRQAQLAAQAQAVALQRQGFLDPFAAITGSADQNLLGQLLGTNQANQANQTNLYGSLLNYGGDLNNTNYNANAAANIAGYNGQQALYGSLISAGSNLGGAYLRGNNTTGAGTTCWVAREVFGEDNPKWKQFREWLFLCAPLWFFNFYVRHGQSIAAWVKSHPFMKPILRRWMESRIAVLNRCVETSIHA
tara:strand:- start:3303 stop:5183 length:1881 start_codon:yes stop_codon:yes gene_type:complete